MEKPATVSSPRDQPLMSQHFAHICTNTLNLDYLPPTNTHLRVCNSPLVLAPLSMLIPEHRITGYQIPSNFIN